MKLWLFQMDDILVIYEDGREEYVTDEQYKKIVAQGLEAHQKEQSDNPVEAWFQVQWMNHLRVRVGSEPYSAQELELLVND